MTISEVSHRFTCVSILNSKDILNQFYEKSVNSQLILKLTGWNDYYVVVTYRERKIKRKWSIHNLLGNNYEINFKR